MRVVLVHGLWHGAWCWQPVIEALDRAGVAAVAVELPMRTLAADTAVVRAAVERAGDDVLLVGHSYGGAVVTAAGAHPAVAHLVYLAGFALNETESISRVAPETAIGATDLGAALRFSADGEDVTIDSGRAAGLLYNRTPAIVAAAAIARLRPVGRALFAGRPAAAAWRDKPATYVVCTADQTVAPDLQRIMAARVTTALEWDSDHSPQASRPEDVAALLLTAER